MKKNTRLILALDLTQRKKAVVMARELNEFFDAIKIGYPLILHAGLEVIKDVASNATVIADLKLADIPNTNSLICEAVLEAGANGLIAHAFPGLDSLQACADSTSAHGADLFVVTEMSHPGAKLFMAPLVEEMSKMAVEVGATGVIAPATRPEVLSKVRAVIGDKIIISPGIGAQGGSPAKALQKGADFLIVGRSILQTKDPKASVKELLLQIAD